MIQALALASTLILAPIDEVEPGYMTEWRATIALYHLAETKGLDTFLPAAQVWWQSAVTDIPYPARTEMLEAIGTRLPEGTDRNPDAQLSLNLRTSMGIKDPATNSYYDITLSRLTMKSKRPTDVFTPEKPRDWSFPPSSREGKLLNEARTDVAKMLDSLYRSGHFPEGLTPADFRIGARHLRPLDKADAAWFVEHARTGLAFGDRPKLDALLADPAALSKCTVSFAVTCSYDVKIGSSSSGRGFTLP